MTGPGSLGFIGRSPAERAFGDAVRRLQDRVDRLEAQRPCLVTEATDSAVRAATPTTLATVLTHTVTVPSGFTTAAVFLTVTYAASGSGSSLTIRAGIGGINSPTASSTTANARQILNDLVTDLSGGATFDLTVAVGSVGLWGGGTAALSATVIYFR